MSDQLTGGLSAVGTAILIFVVVVAYISNKARQQRKHGERVKQHSGPRQPTSQRDTEQQDRHIAEQRDERTDQQDFAPGGAIVPCTFGLSEIETGSADRSGALRSPKPRGERHRESEHSEDLRHCPGCCGCERHCNLSTTKDARCGNSGRDK